MPELPEVEVVRRGLADHVVGRTIAEAAFRGTRVTRRHELGPDHLAAVLTHRTVAAARRRGKYLWLVVTSDLDPSGAEESGPDHAPDAGEGGAPGLVPPHGDRLGLLIHLGMSGQLLVEAADAPDEKHLHARFGFVDGDPELRFVDQRTFGGVALSDLDADDVPLSIVHIAPDPFEPTFDETAVVRRMKASHSAVKRLLLDQRLVSGIGNIYADEALWRAQVHGERPASALTKPTLARILGHAREVMADALDQGGTSFDALYVNVNGASGYFDRSLAAYGQAGRPCRRCGTPIRRESFMNRSSFSCPRCQPRPRPRAAPTPSRRPARR